MVRAQWVANGSTGAVDNVANFGGADLDTNAAGWPTNTTDGNNSVASDTSCVEVWNGVMQNPPTVVATSGTADYVATSAGQVCTYAYSGDTATTRSIAYNAANGAISVTNP
jgi:hypothetical protein